MASGGSLYFELIPTLSGASSRILEQFTGPAGDAGVKAGEALGKGIADGADRAASSAGRVIVDQTARAGTQAGTQAGRAISEGVTRAATSAGTDAGRAITSGVVDQARGAGTSAGAEIASGVTTAAGRAGAEAGAQLATGVTEQAARAGADAGREIATGVTTAAATAGTEMSEELGAAGARAGARMRIGMSEGIGGGVRVGVSEGVGALNELGEAVKGLGEAMFLMWGLEKAKEFFTESVKGAEDLNAAQRQTAAAITSTGGAADMSSDEVKELSEKMSDLSGHTDLAEQQMHNILLTFPEVRNEAGKGNDVFNQTSLAVNNLAARLGGDLNGAAVQVGKALGNPTQGLTALTRVGVVFTDQQKEQIKQLDASGHKMEAQKIILGELNREFAGSAQAAATPAERMHAAWDRFGVDVAQKVLPTLENIGTKVLTDVIPALNGMVEWGERNEEWVKGLAIVIGSALGAWIVYKAVVGTVSAATSAYKAVTEGAAAATKILTFSLEGMEAAEAATGIGLIVVVLAAVVAGLIYAYNHFEWFRDGVDDCWEVIKEGAEAVWHGFLEPIFDAIGTAISWVVDHWRLLAIVLGIVFAPLGIIGGAIYLLVTHWHDLVNAGEAACHGIATAATWLWQNVLSPVFSAISIGARILAAIVVTVLVTPFVLGFQLMAAIATWLWHAAIEPAFNGIAAVAHWLYDNAILPVANAVAAVWHWLYDTAIRVVSEWWTAEVRGLAAIYNWFHDNVWVPVSNAVAAVFHWLYDNAIRPVVALWEAEVQALATMWHWFHDNVWQPVSQAIATVFHWVYDNAIRPVSDAIGVTIHAVGQVFSDVVDWIGRTWRTIQDITRVPVSFVVNTVYGKGIKPVWDHVAGLFGLPAAPDAPAFAGGGVLGGHQPGVDSIPAMLSPGEAVLVPELVRAIGPSTILGWNAAASGGRPATIVGAMGGGLFAGGGLADGDLGGAANMGANVLPTFGGLASGVLQSLGNLFDVPELWSDPRGYFTGLIKPVQDAYGGLRKSSWVDTLAKLPGTFVDGVVKKAQDWIASQMSGGAAMGPESASHAADIVTAAHAKGIPRPGAVIAIMTGIQESGLRVLANPSVPGSMALPHDGVGSDHDSVGIFQQRQSWGPTALLMNPFGSAELFYNKLGRGPYGDYGAEAQRVQVSAFPGAYEPHRGQAEAMVPQYDIGGLLPRGVSLARNDTGGNERMAVFTTDQWATLGALPSVVGSFGSNVGRYTAHLGDRITASVTGMSTVLTSAVDRIVAAVNASAAATAAAASAAASAKAVTPAPAAPAGPARLPVDELNAARELLARWSKGGQVFEDLSFRGMSANLGTWNDDLADRFYAAGGGDLGDFLKALVARGYSGGGIVGPLVRDTGGPLPTGTSLVYNGTGRTEHVVTGEQLGALRAGGTVVHKETHIHGDNRTVQSIATELEWREQRDVALAGVGG